MSRAATKSSANEGRKLLRKVRAMEARPVSRNLVLDFTQQPVMASMIRCVMEGEASEMLCVGARGDGKTIGAFTAMLAHAKRHEEHGFALPVDWMGVMDTFRSHELKTIRSLEEPLWQGCWTLSGDGRVARGWTEGRRKLLVEVHLFGVEDQGAKDKMRMAAHCLWVDEAAPTAVLVQSSGIDESAFLLGLTSLRSPSHANVALITENYPDEDHWTWLRFYQHEAPGGTRRLFRIPPGERADPAQRAKWAEALKDRPDLLKRLLSGQPGGVMLGPQVAAGFNQDLHVAKGRLRALIHEPVAVGQDFGHTPTTIIGQSYQGEMRVLVALASERGGVKQHLEQLVLPWLSTHAPWVLKNPDYLIGEYDPAGEIDEQTDIEQDPAGLLEEMLPGRWQKGPVAWQVRRDRLIAGLNAHLGPGRCALQIDPVDGRPLIQALNGRWYYPQKASGQLSQDKPKKPNHPYEDYGDAFIHWLGALSCSVTPRSNTIIVETDYALGGVRR